MPRKEPRFERGSGRAIPQLAERIGSRRIGKGTTLVVPFSPENKSALQRLRSALRLQDDFFPQPRAKALFCKQIPVNSTSKRSADERCIPEHPQLLHGPDASKNRGASAAGRVHGSVGDGNAYQ